MRNGRVFARLLGLSREVIEDAVVDQDASLVVAVRPRGAGGVSSRALRPAGAGL